MLLGRCLASFFCWWCLFGPDLLAFLGVDALFGVFGRWFLFNWAEMTRWLELGCKTFWSDQNVLHPIYKSNPLRHYAAKHNTMETNTCLEKRRLNGPNRGY